MKPQLPDLSSSVVLYTNSSQGIIDPTGTEARQYFLVCFYGYMQQARQEAGYWQFYEQRTKI